MKNNCLGAYSPESESRELEIITVAKNTLSSNNNNNNEVEVDKSGIGLTFVEHVSVRRNYFPVSYDTVAFRIKQ